MKNKKQAVNAVKIETLSEDDYRDFMERAFITTKKGKALEDDFGAINFVMRKAHAKFHRLSTLLKQEFGTKVDLGVQKEYDGGPWLHFRSNDIKDHLGMFGRICKEAYLVPSRQLQRVIYSEDELTYVLHIDIVCDFIEGGKQSFYLCQVYFHNNDWFLPMVSSEGKGYWKVIGGIVCSA